METQIRRPMNSLVRLVQLYIADRCYTLETVHPEFGKLVRRQLEAAPPQCLYDWAATALQRVGNGTAGTDVLLASMDSIAAECALHESCDCDCEECNAPARQLG